MQAVILVGGLGTRLRPLTNNMPKPMAPVFNKPFLEHLILKCKREGVTEFVLATHYLACQIEDYFQSGKKWGVKINYAYEKELLGSAGALRNCRRYLKNTFFILNGDTYFKFSLKDVWRFHRQKRALATIAGFKKRFLGNPDLLLVDKTGRLTFFGKQPGFAKKFAYVNSGVVCFNKRIFQEIPSSVPLSLEKEIYPGLITKNKPIYGYFTRERVIDMGSLDEYALLKRSDLLRGLTF